MREVAVTGVGLVCPLGTDPTDVAAALDAGRSGLRSAEDARDRLPVPGFGFCDVDVRPLLKRRKDRKLLPRAAELALCAASDALGDDRPGDVGLFLGVGREPPDGAETEAALVGCARDGRFDVDRLAEHALPAWPPLASLKTLPNLVLAHVAIQLDLTGEGGTRAGEEAAGMAAVVEGFRAVAEGRSDVVLAGAADSRVDGGSARDLVRLGRAGRDRAPSEAAAVLRLEPYAPDRPALAVLEAGGTGFRAAPTWRPEWEAHLGSCGAAAGPLAMILDIARGASGTLHVAEAEGASAWVRWRCLPTC